MGSASSRGWFVALVAAATVVAAVAATPAPISIPGALVVTAVVIAVLTRAVMGYSKMHPVLADGHLDSHVLNLFAGGLVAMTIAYYAIAAAFTALGALIILGLPPKDVATLEEVTFIARFGGVPTFPRGMSRALIEWLLVELTPTNIGMIVYSALIATGATEEILKWFMVRVSLSPQNESASCCFQPRSSRSVRATASLMVSVALGFALFETLIMLRNASPYLLNQLLVAALRLLVPMPFHALTALWSAARLSKRDLDDSGPAFELRAEAGADAPHGAGGTPAPLVLTRRELADPVRSGQVSRCSRAKSTCVVLAPAIFMNGLYQVVVTLVHAAIACCANEINDLGASAITYSAGAVVMLLTAIGARLEFKQVADREDVIADLAGPEVPTSASGPVAMLVVSPIQSASRPSVVGNGAAENELASKSKLPLEAQPEDQRSQQAAATAAHPRRTNQVSGADFGLFL